jgi:hypothetical protein
MVAIVTVVGCCCCCYASETFAPSVEREAADAAYGDFVVVEC